MEKDALLYETDTPKSIHDFVEGIKQNASQFNYYVRHVHDLREEYRDKGIDLDEDFEMVQIVVCSFNYKGLQKNIRRCAVLLAPKQITVFREMGKTVINYLPFPKPFIQQALPGDEDFAENQSKACQRIIQLIEAAI
jgi:hypothetical protein